jgi:hypothetical protein
MRIMKRGLQLVDSCKYCGDDMMGDGYTLPFHCINALEADWWYSAPDSGPYYCDFREDNDGQN